MKRFILQLLVLLFTVPLVAQTNVYLSGYISDISLGGPYPNQEVTIQSDSGSGGFIYYNNVFTNVNGIYADTIPLPLGVTSGTLIITTIDCQGIPHTATQAFSPGNMTLTQDFQICSVIPCQADFTWTSYGTLTVQFTDLSTWGTGTTGPWNWSFDDGTTSSLQNPSHTYAQGGYYDVTLTIGDSSSACWDMITKTVHVIDSTGGSCVASFVYNPDPAGGNTVYFYDQSTGNINSWTWDFGDGQSSTLQNPVHTYAQAGLYTVCLTVQGVDSSCYDTYCLPVQVGNIPGNCVADFIYFPDSAGVMNTYQFIDMSTGNINSWYWDFGDGTFSTEQNPVHFFTSPGFYTVCLTVQGVDSLCYDTYCEIVNIGGPVGCQAQFTYYPDSAWNSTLVHFLDLSSGDIISWFWDFGDSTFSTEQNPSHLFPDNGTYYVCLTIEGTYQGAICTSTWCEEVVAGNNSGCASYFTYQNNGLSISFEGHMVNGQSATYSWDFGDGQTGQGQSIIHQYSIAGIYYATLTTVTIDPTGGCTFSTGQSITVGDSTQWNQIYGQVFAGNFPLEAGIVMIFSLDTSFNFLPFIDISMVDSSGVYYFPMVPQGDFLIYAIPILPFGYFPTYYGDIINWEDATIVSLGQAANPYDINLVVADSYTSGIGTINGQINTVLKTTLIDKITMLLMNDAGQPISFHQVDEDGVFTFPELDYGIYYLRGELAGCQSDYVKVEITQQNPQIDVVMTFSGNQILGIHDSKPVLEAGVVYPNPATDQANITIKLESASLVTIELYNLTGQLAFRQTKHLGAGETTLKVPAGQLRNGIYSLRIYTDSGLSLTRKLLISQ